MKNLLICLGIINGLIGFISCRGGKTDTLNSKNDTATQNIINGLLIGLVNKVPNKHYLPLKEFSEKWQADTSKNSFRGKSLDYDTSTYNIVSVNGINFLNSGVSQIEDLLGKPDIFASSGDSLTLDYFLAPNCAFTEVGCYRWVLELKFKKGSVTSFYTSYINTD